jgi:hypothetical protein
MASDCVRRNSHLNRIQAVFTSQLLVQVMAEVRCLDRFKIEKPVATMIMIPAATGSFRRLGIAGMKCGLGFIHDRFVLLGIGHQVNQAAPLKGGFPDCQSAFFLAKFSQEPPLVETGRFGAGILELLPGQFHTETSAQESGAWPQPSRRLKPGHSHQWSLKVVFVIKAEEITL